MYGSPMAPQLDPETTQRVGPYPPTMEPPPVRQPVQPPPVQPVRQPPPPPAATRVEPRVANPGYRPGQAATPVYPPGVSRGGYREPQQYEQQQYREPAYAEPARAVGSGGGGRAARIVFVTMLLVLTPIVCGVIAYRFTAGVWPLP
ncbi:hypothetical protein GCM10009557_67470 [Virgisporangium ochraceum]|uniref:Uncharacterized protein n=1 Tax=Virgisporangium ochraceum TaxID=65505 RepID=A0A8J3ZVH8_9ACTN|nr:hypothetical protein Voc01_041420 [Virgisporangium ochraceum]